jgi:hypothetical protein
MSLKHTDFVLTTRLEGFISLKPSGKYNNCRIGFTLSDEEFDKFEAEYTKAIEAGTAEIISKYPGSRVSVEAQPWGEDGCIKYSYGNPDPGPEDSKKPDFLWVHGPDNLPFDLSTTVYEGSTVQLAIRLKSYVFGKKVGLSLRVRAGKIISVVSKGQAPPPVTKDEAASLFGAGPVLEPEANDDIPF